MDLLLILTYTALCIAIFKVFKIPLNKWTVPTAVLGGVVIIGALLLIMNYNHPYSETVRQYFVTTPVIPEVRGRVIEVPVQPNVWVEEGSVLFRIDPEPFQYKVDGLEAELDAAKKDLARFEELYLKQAGTQRNRDEAKAKVDDLQAKLDDARFDLSQTIVTAPSDGFVTQLILRPGMMAVPLPLAPVMTFVHKEPRVFFGWFRQNSLLRLKKGSKAEVSLDGIPGTIFEGEVTQVMPAIGNGQLKPGGDFLRFGIEQGPGRIAVAMQITDPKFDDYLVPMGAFGQAAIYSEHFHHVGIMRKILLRMSAWMNYVFPLH